MSNPAKALFTLLLVMIAVVFIIYCSGSFVTSTQKESYEEALQSATQTATLSMIDTSNINDLYDGGRKESGDIPIDHSSLDYFRENLAQLLYNNKSGIMGSVSNINIPLVGYISYDYIFGVTYGEAYSSVKALANQNKTVSEYLSSDITSRVNNSKRGTYLLPMGYVHPIHNLGDLGITTLNGKQALMCFTLGDIIHIRRDIENTLDTINTAGDLQYKNTDDQYVIYTSGCEICGDKEISDCCIHRIDSSNGKLWHNDEDTDMPDMISIRNFIDELKFHNIYQLRDYIVMNTINTYLSQYSGRGFSDTADNISTSLNLSLSLSDISVDNKAYTENSTVIDGPGVFAIIDLYKGSKDNKQTVQRLASFGSSELKRVTNSSGRGTSTGGISGTNPGNPGNPDNPGDKPGTPTTSTVKVTLHPNGGSGEEKYTSVVLTNGQATIKAPNCTFIPPSGKIFKCWKDSITNKQYYPNSTITVTNNITLLAIWDTDIDNSFNIEYYVDGKLYNENPIYVPKGTEFTILNINSTTEKPFLGWALTPDSNIVSYTGGTKCKPTSDMKLYAVWDTGEDIIISAPEVYAVYDGKPHEVNPKVNISNFDISIVYTNNANSIVDKPIDAGEYRATIVVTNGIEKQTVVTTVTIDKKVIEVTTSNNSKVYDGEPLVGEGKYIGLVAGETIDFKVTGIQIEVGQSDNTFEIYWTGTAKESNYTIESNLGILEVFADNFTEVSIVANIMGIDIDDLINYKLQISYIDKYGNSSGEIITKSDAIVEKTDEGFKMLFNITLEKDIEYSITQSGLTVPGYEWKTQLTYTDLNSSKDKTVNIDIEYTEIQKDKLIITLIPWNDYNSQSNNEFAFYICIDNNSDSNIHGKLDLILPNSIIKLDRIDEVTGSEGRFTQPNDVEIPSKLAGSNYEVILMVYTTITDTKNGEDIYVNIVDTLDNITYTSNTLQINGGKKYTLDGIVSAIESDYIMVNPKAGSDYYTSFANEVTIDINTEALGLKIGDAVRIVYTDYIGTNTGIDTLYDIVSIAKS